MVEQEPGMWTYWRRAGARGFTILSGVHVEYRNTFIVGVGPRQPDHRRTCSAPPKLARTQSAQMPTPFSWSDANIGILIGKLSDGKPEKTQKYVSFAEDIVYCRLQISTEDSEEETPNVQLENRSRKKKAHKRNKSQRKLLASEQEANQRTQAIHFWNNTVNKECPNLPEGVTNDQAFDAWYELGCSWPRLIESFATVEAQFQAMLQNLG